MSTYWYFECLDHDPPLKSLDEFTQHTDDDAFNLALELAEHRADIESPWSGEWYSAEGYFEKNARRFLVQHPSCRLGIVNEYGERRSLSIPASADPKEEP